MTNELWCHKYTNVPVVILAQLLRFGKGLSRCNPLQGRRGLGLGVAVGEVERASPKREIRQTRVKCVDLRTMDRLETKDQL